MLVSSSFSCESAFKMKIAVTDYSFANLDVEEGILRPLGYELISLK